MDPIFFDSLAALLRTALLGVLGYVSLVFLLRVSGRRTLSKMNAFDLVVTVALGSVLATVMLSKDVTLVQGALAFALLVGMQYLVTWASVRWRWVRQLVTGEPALLLFQGEYLPSALLKARVTKDEVRAAARAAGMADLSEIAAVILETDGSFSVLGQRAGGTGSSLDGVKAPGRGEGEVETKD
ncbi:DUF421 domain-containing protein [Halomonas sp. LR3S48]|uniref:DUF421 domain-containing protein n=1 Tax=Halomonas sp. LR3S48 TaxID=2982694 RepID=UPI0021E47DA1|nr:YetF domain-containing protein [Halomonas sp. LR3S48]UYG02015.1 DUF421 domain-containing protein [Halomonas sp. LR3S48]